MALILKNPHSILATIEARSKDVGCVVIPSSRTESGETWALVERLARQRGIRVSLASKKEGPHAAVKARESVMIEELFIGEKTDQGVWLLLDCLHDPHNVGAIFRTASFFGVKGIVMAKDRAAPMSDVVYDVASGGVEYVPFAIETNLKHVIDLAKEAGLWVLGTSEHTHNSFNTIGPDRNWLLVLGNEEKGMRRLTEESCDLVCKITPLGRVGSLNVSVATGVMLTKISSGCSLPVDLSKRPS